VAHHRRASRPTSTIGSLPGWKAASSLRFSTQVSHRCHIDHYLVPHLGRRALDELRPAHNRAINRELLDGPDGSGLSPSTVRRIHATLHAALEAAVREELIARNPASGIELPTRPYRELVTWTLEQATAFLRGLDDADPVHLVFRLMLLRCLRRGDALGLAWGTSTWSSLGSVSGSR